jgi:hypothetical protein
LIGWRVDDSVGACSGCCLFAVLRGITAGSFCDLFAMLRGITAGSFCDLFAMLRGITVGSFCGLFALLSGITFVVDSVVDLFAGLKCGLFALLSGMTFVVDSVVDLFAGLKVRRSPVVVGLSSRVTLPAVPDLPSVVRLAAPVGFPVLWMFLSGWRACGAVGLRAAVSADCEDCPAPVVLLFGSPFVFPFPSPAPSAIDASARLQIGTSNLIRGLFNCWSGMRRCQELVLLQPSKIVTLSLVSNSLAQAKLTTGEGSQEQSPRENG